MTGDPGPGPAIEAELNDHIAITFADHGGLVTKWVAIIEAIGTAPDTDAVGPGTDTELWTLTSDGLKAWDTEGMLSHALTKLRTQSAALDTGLLNDDGTGPFR